MAYSRSLKKTAPLRTKVLFVFGLTVIGILMSLMIVGSNQNFNLASRAASTHEQCTAFENVCKNSQSAVQAAKTTIEGIKKKLQACEDVKNDERKYQSLRCDKYNALPNIQKSRDILATYVQGTSDVLTQSVSTSSDYLTNLFNEAAAILTGMQDKKQADKNGGACEQYHACLLAGNYGGGGGGSGNADAPNLKPGEVACPEELRDQPKASYFMDGNLCFKCPATKFVRTGPYDKSFCTGKQSDCRDAIEYYGTTPRNLADDACTNDNHCNMLTGKCEKLAPCKGNGLSCSDSPTCGIEGGIKTSTDTVPAKGFCSRPEQQYCCRYLGTGGANGGTGTGGTGINSKGNGGGYGSGNERGGAINDSNGGAGGDKTRLVE